MMEMVLYRPDTPHGRSRTANAATTPADQPVGAQMSKKKREVPPPRPSHMMGSKLMEMAGCTYVQPSAAPDAPKERRKKNPALKLKSYLLQEAEAVSRGAKAEWAAGQGVRVVSLQHDGVVFHALPDGLTAEEVAEQLSAAASRAAGYEVVVEPKHIGPSVPVVG